MQVTTTTTQSVQATVTSGVDQTPPDRFYIVASTDGQYGRTSLNVAGNTGLSFTGSAITATTFSLQGTDLVAGGGLVANESPVSPLLSPALVIFSSPGGIAAGNNPISCTFVATSNTCSLDCVGNGGNVDSYDGLLDFYYLGTSSVLFGTTFTPLVVAA